MEAFVPRVLQIHSLAQLRAELERVGADFALEEKVARAAFRLLKLERVSLPLARFLYQELVMEGGQVVTAPRLDHVGEGTTDVLLCGTRYQFQHLCVRLRWQPNDECVHLAELLERSLDRFDAPPPALHIGKRLFEWGRRAFVMGVLDLAPDPCDGEAIIRPGETEAAYVRRAVTRAQELLAAGADLLDIGGAFTPLGASAVEVEGELARVIPVLRALARETDAPLAIATRTPRVAAAALEAGAHLINDGLGLSDPEMRRVVAMNHVPVIAVHHWLHRPKPVLGAHTVHELVLRELAAQIEDALESGIPAERILVNPGLGLGKSADETLTLLNHLGELRALGHAIVIEPWHECTEGSPSTDGSPTHLYRHGSPSLPTDDEGLAAAVAVGIVRGADVICAHDVRTVTRAARVADAIVRSD